jgi:hypothetical protein
MSANVQQPTQTDNTAVLRAISSERFATYLTAAGHNQQRALSLYIWNAQIGEAFHLPIQAVEVALRNALNDCLSSKYGLDWWKDKTLSDLLDEERTGDLSQVLRRISNRKLTLCNGQIVAGLSLGFWVGMLHNRYYPMIWSTLFERTFPNLPAGRGRKSLSAKAGEVAVLRNRIWHHEPLIRRDVSADFANVIDLLSWLSPAKAAWIKPHCRVPALLRLKP